MHYARVRDSATTRKVRRYPPEGYPGIPEGDTAVLHFNANVPRINGPETPAPHPTPPIPKYPHLSTTTDTPVHPPARTPTPAPNSPTPPHPSQPPDTRTTNPTTHTPIAVHPATNPDQTPKPPGQPTNTRPGTQPTQTHTRPPEASSRPFRVWANRARPAQDPAPTRRHPPTQIPESPRYPLPRRGGARLLRLPAQGVPR